MDAKGLSSRSLCDLPETVGEVSFTLLSNSFTAQIYFGLWRSPELHLCCVLGASLPTSSFCTARGMLAFLVC